MYHENMKNEHNIRGNLSYQERRRDRPDEARQPVHFFENERRGANSYKIGWILIDEKGGCERIHALQPLFRL